MEPQDYFAEVKKEVHNMDDDTLRERLKVVQQELIKAHAIGQETVVERLLFAKTSIAKEIMAVANGFERYVVKSAIANLIDDVKPKDSVKIIELARYPRIIPDANLKDIQRAKELEIFDDFCVVFTDLSGENLETAEDIEFKQRNRDPIVFGYHKLENTSFRSDRFYFITDWEDEFCDLTFDKLINKLPVDAHGVTNGFDTEEDVNKLLNDIEKEYQEKNNPKHGKKIKKTSILKKAANIFKS